VQTAEFFALVLPTEGLRCVATSEQGGFAHQFFERNDLAARRTLAIDATRSVPVYFGCASYLTSDNRTGANVAKVRSFWLDIDCGPEKPYATQQDGILALAGFKKKTGLPTPWVVNSGYGLHVYWPMDADMTPGEWRPIALALKAATLDLKLRVDQSRTGDIATVLRAVGTHNRKGESCEVVLIKAGGSMGRLKL
jgi:hypothetical protein